MYGTASRKGLQTPFLTSVNQKDIYVRTSTEERTFHVRLHAAAHCAHPAC